MTKQMNEYQQNKGNLRRPDDALKAHRTDYYHVINLPILLEWLRLDFQLRAHRARLNHHLDAEIDRAGYLVIFPAAHVCSSHKYHLNCCFWAADRNANYYHRFGEKIIV